MQAEYDEIASMPDVLFVAAAGNDYHSNNDKHPVYPGSYDLPNVLAVLATDASDQLAYFSNIGR